MQALDEELKSKRATGAAGGGLVEVEVNGLGEVLAVRIDPSLVEKQDREMIEDLLPAAFNAAAQEGRSSCTPKRMQSITGGMQLPGPATTLCRSSPARCRAATASSLSLLPQCRRCRTSPASFAPRASPFPVPPESQGTNAANLVACARISPRHSRAFRS